MVKTEVIRNRALLTKYNCIGKISCDNEQIYFTVNNESRYFKWDDTNECFYVLANPDGPIAQGMGTPSGPYANSMIKELSVVPYENIQKITFQIPANQIIKLLTEDMGETSEDAKAIFEGFTDDFRY